MSAGTHAAEQVITLEGRVVEVQPAARFVVELAGGHRVLAHLAGRLRRHRIRGRPRRSRDGGGLRLRSDARPDRPPRLRRMRPSVLVLALVAGCAHHRGAGTDPSPIDGPMADVWPAVNRWTERLEREYGEFVERLGDAVETRRCGKLDACLRDPAVNTTFEPGVDAGLELAVDCADLPYVLRAYFSFKRRLPFGFVAATKGRGPDIRYAVDVVPTEWRTWRDFRTPRALVHEMTGLVHSGMYRIAPAIETADFYPVRIDRRAVRPGSIFYDPNGHVLVVARVTADGAVYLLDGHPDGSLTWKRFGAAFAVGTARLGGGFKDFRPLRMEDGGLVRAPNAELADFDASTQYAPPAPYHLWVRAALAEAGVVVDPVADFRDQVRALCRDALDRVDAVDQAVGAGIAEEPHPASLPENIYGTLGDWEIYSTPSRDARLKAAFRELADGVHELPDRADRVPALRAAWDEEVAAPSCQIAYRSSRGAMVALTLDVVLDRLFDLSFDPYHCPELRWGAPAGSDERAGCPDGPDKLDWYARERRLRNRIDRDYGVPTPLASGPDEAPDVDVRHLLER